MSAPAPAPARAPAPGRRAWLRRLAAWAAGAGVLHPAGAAGTGTAAASGPISDRHGAAAGDTVPADPVRRGRPLAFPRDHGAHLGSRIEWWYATGWLAPSATAAQAVAAGRAAPALGFQVTFFRSRTGLAERVAGRFAPRQLLFAHAALTVLDPAAGPAAPGGSGGRPHHLHDQRVARWNGDPAAPLAHAALDDTRVAIGDWRMAREGGTWTARLPAGDFTLDLRLQATQPLLLQGDAGFSRKGPDERQASHYYSAPQLAVQAQVRGAAPTAATATTTAPATAAPWQGRGWLDHEWSDELMHPQAVGWDWVGLNLFDGSALTAFVLRRSDGSVLWAGGSWRTADGTLRVFAPDEVRFSAGRRWTSPATAAVYPVQWRIDHPAGPHTVNALLDAQELDSRGSTGAVYWEGLSEVLDGAGRRVGLGYLEMTGYVGALRL